MVFNLCINLVVTKYKLQSQADSIMTLNCELCQSEFWVLSGRLTIKLSKICFLCLYVDQIVIQQRLVFCFKFSFTIFSLMFFPLFSKVFTNILKIYELPKTYNKILKIFLTIIIYQINSISQLHLASELYWKYALESKRLICHLIKKNPR